ncbi:MAG: polysaccharide deacetylase family protein [Silvibacterium sp.]|nr:polysaccharide deacetylase family protein [Silvibacterium sp.]MBV8437215.1 polysaccharide deacetylase family protein [Silvibacterium sp.]
MLSTLSAAAVAGLTVGGYFYAGMWPTSQIFGKTILAGRDPNEYALTYDDGPNDVCTEQLLEVLARHNVRATFFLIGRFVRERRDLTRRIHAAGHLIGNHTFTHPVLLFESPSRAREELASTNAAIEDAIGEPVRYFRPPHGARRPDVLRTARELGLTPVLWNAVGNDWKPALNPEAILANLEKGIRRNRERGQGSNLLLHDGGQAGIGQDRRATIAATANFLARAKQQQIRFVTVDAWNAGAPER